MIVRHIADDVRDQDLPLFEQFVEGHGFVGRADKAALIIQGHVLATRSQELMHGSIVTFRIDDEGAAQGIIDAFVFIKITGIEKAPRVLAVERSDDLPCIEVGRKTEPESRRSQTLVLLFRSRFLSRRHKWFLATLA
jgi:hypothetical protein